MGDADAEDVDDMPALLKEKEGARNFVQKAKAAASRLSDWLVDYVTYVAHALLKKPIYLCSSLFP